jgi:aspartyl-tRNA(Asn)/glutamyl-tRNA(Gln) amidotransferase subunit B
VEIKNLNSFRHIQRALQYEVDRQQQVLESGDSLVQETRLWDEDQGGTLPMRSKEDVHDYRYFPDPDLPPLELSEGWVERLRSTIPELPGPRRARFMQAHGLPEPDAEMLTEERDLADFFEAVAERSGNARAASNWVRGDLLRVLKERHAGAADSPVSAASLGDLIRLIDDGTISGKIAKTVFEEMAGDGGTPGAIIERLGLVQITDEGALRAMVERAVADHPGPAAQFRAGKATVLGFFVGQVMKTTSGKANPEMVNRLLRDVLGSGGEGS